MRPHPHLCWQACSTLAATCRCRWDRTDHAPVCVRVCACVRVNVCVRVCVCVCHGTDRAPECVCVWVAT